MSIPKIIHYCWFGGKTKPKSVEILIKDWKKKLPDYEIFEWNEKNFDVKKSNAYVRKSYNEKKWAFVSDYVRIYALYEYGGIYLDTDVEVLSNFDLFLNEHFCVSHESETSLCTAIIISEKKNNLLKDFLDTYENDIFIFDKNIEANSVRLKKFLSKKFNNNFEFNKEYINDEIHIYNRNIFGAKDIHNYKEYVDEKTVAIHHLDASWYSSNRKFLRNIKRKILSLINKK